MGKNKVIAKVRGNDQQKLVTIPKKSNIQVDDYVSIEKLEDEE